VGERTHEHTVAVNSSHTQAAASKMLQLDMAYFAAAGRQYQATDGPSLISAQRVVPGVRTIVDDGFGNRVAQHPSVTCCRLRVGYAWAA
jgi:hypothetical protein